VAPPEPIRAALAELVPEYQGRDLAPLPAAERAAPPSISVAPGVAPAPPRRSSHGKRILDIAAAALLLAVLAPWTGLLLLLYRLSGPGRVEFEREEWVGQNQRRGDRRRDTGDARIDRRFRDRRARTLPGRPFAAYRIQFHQERRNRPQEALAGFLERRRLHRMLLLWSVVRGDMSLVGPSVRLVEEATLVQNRTTAWIHARRPGLIGPGQFFGGPGEAGSSRAAQYDSFYARFGSPRLDLELLWRALVWAVRGDNTEQEFWSSPLHEAGAAGPARREGKS